MTVETVNPSPDSALAGTFHPRPPRRVLGLGSGQIVAAQLALAMIAIAAQFHWLALAIAVPIAAGMVVLGWGRMRGRWLSEWLSVGMRYRSRERRLDPGVDSGGLLALAHPGSRVSTFDIEATPAAMIADGEGLVALLELGESAVIPGRAWHPLPSPASLLPAPAPDTPPVRLQLLLHAVATTGAAPVAASYRQLTGGRLLASERAVLAVRVQRAEGWSDHDLERALSGAVRKVRAKLGTVAHRPLGEVAALRVLGEFAGHDGTQPAQEGWAAMHIGGLLQTTYSVERWPQSHPDPSHALLPRLLRLPATMSCVSLTAGPWKGAGDQPAGTIDQLPAQLTVRVATPDQTSLGNAVTALKQVLASDHAHGRRLDGEQMDGLLATLPLAGPTPAGIAPEAHLGPQRRAAAVAALTTPYGGSGLMIGVNRHQEPVAFRIFRPEATRIVLIGGVPIAQTLAVRAMALGAHVLVQTTRPGAWEAFSRGLGSGAALTVMAPGPVTVPPGQPLHPLLTIVDAGPVAADRSPGSPWHSTLVLRDDLSPVDVDVLGRADLALLQPLHPAEAAVAVSVLGLSRDQESWLSRAQPGMVGVVHRRSVRWAALSQTQYEQQLIGGLNRQR
ncbi:MAG TPA: type VII secretion protein EccE [Micromonosporaceae bacterium]|nr:type VII secretion protein EccE [Micromonosporaceae bacterium]